MLATTTASAGPSSTCSFDGTTRTATIDVAAGDLVTVRRAADAITLDGVACGAATVVNTDLISIVAVQDEATESVVISLAGGPLFPGFTAEDDGSSEIELEIDLKGGLGDGIEVLGSSGDDAISAGSHALDLATLNLNANEAVYDSDVTVSQPFLLLEVWGLRGDDRLSLWGPEGFAQFGLPQLHGGPGSDRLLGVLQFEQDHLDGGTGRDAIDYSAAPDGYESGAWLIWGVDGSTIGAGNDEDLLTDVEVAYLGSDSDDVLYEAGAIGETYGGAGHDFFVADAQPGSGEPGRRIVHGGEGGDQVTVVTDQDVVVDLNERTFRGAWYASYSSIWAITTGDGDDTVIARKRGAYPYVLTEGGVDTLDLRAATQRMYVAAAGVAAPNDGRRWLVSFTERVLGSSFNDILWGDELPNHLYGFDGNDYLLGRAGDDLLVGGPGSDILVGGSGTDTCQGGAGKDDVAGCSP